MQQQFTWGSHLSPPPPKKKLQYFEPPNVSNFIFKTVIYGRDQIEYLWNPHVEAVRVNPDIEIPGFTISAVKQEECDPIESNLAGECSVPLCINCKIYDAP